MLQQSVNTKQAFGLVGTFYDDSARRVAPYNVHANPTQAVAATGTITLGANPTADDTVTVADKTYKFVSALAAANDVLIGTDAAATIANLVAAINGATGAGTTYGTGTVANAYVSAEAGSGEVDLTAKTAGLSGNAIALSASFTSGSNTVTAFAGGADAGDAPFVGRAFTTSAANVNDAVCGGTGVFAGILVSPHEMVVDGLGASLKVAENSVGELCTMGHVVVKSTTAVSVGYVCAFDKTTGELAAYANAGSVPGTHTLIANAKFVYVNASVGEVAVLEL